jgi:hypothetical protein
MSDDDALFAMAALPYTPAEIDRMAGELRRLGWTVTPPDPDAKTRVRRDAPATSKAVEPRLGSIQADILELIRWKGRTDDELEEVLRRSHQSVSASRNTLARKGLIRDSGTTRKNRYMNDAIVWVATDRREPA